METLEPIVLAYLEPGSGSIIIQTLVAMLFSLGFFLRRWIGMLCAPLVRPFRRARSDQAEGAGGGSGGSESDSIRQG